MVQALNGLASESDEEDLAPTPQQFCRSLLADLLGLYFAQGFLGNIAKLIL